MGARVGEGEEDREDPEHHDGPQGTLAGALQLGAEGMEDGKVSLHADRGHAEDGGEAHCLKERCLEIAADGPEQEGVVAPHLVDFQGHPKKQHKQVWDSEAEEVVIGRGLHVPVLKDHQAN